MTPRLFVAIDELPDHPEFRPFGGGGSVSGEIAPCQGCGIRMDWTGRLNHLAGDGYTCDRQESL